MTLTPSQKRVLKLLLEGKNNRQIAIETGWKYQTVRNFLVEIYAILEVHSRIEIFTVQQKVQLYLDR